jgi:hypothetical protein
MKEIKDYKNKRAWLIGETVYQIRTNGKDFIMVHTSIDESDPEYCITRREAGTYEDALISILDSMDDEDFDLNDLLSDLEDSDAQSSTVCFSE